MWIMKSYIIISIMSNKTVVSTMWLRVVVIVVAVTGSSSLSIPKCCPHNYAVQDDETVCLEYHEADSELSWVPSDIVAKLPENAIISTLVPIMQRGLEFYFHPCTKTDDLFRELLITTDGSASQTLRLSSNGDLIVTGEAVFTNTTWCLDRGISLDGEQTGIRVLSCPHLKSRVPLCCASLEPLDGIRTWMECVSDSNKESTACEEPVYREHGVIQSILATTGAMFSLLTFAIHADSPRLRCGLKGFSLMSHCACMLFAHVFLACRPFAHNWGKSGCVAIAVLTQFSLLAAFFWINVRAIIIHSRFRSLSAMIGKAKGLFWYIFYAFGFPALLSSLTVWAQVSQNRPSWIIWPHIHHETCWFGSAAGRGVYFSAPMGVLLILSLALLLIASRQIVIMRRDTALQLNRGSLHTDRKKRAEFRRLKLYLKLFVLMGITFSAEVLAWAGYLLSYYWYTSGVFILLRAVLIFFIFCCTSKIWAEMLHRHPRLRKLLMRCHIHNIAGSSIFYVDPNKITYDQTSTSASKRDAYLSVQAAENQISDEDDISTARDVIDAPVEGGSSEQKRSSEVILLQVFEDTEDNTKRDSAVVPRSYRVLQSSEELMNSQTQSEDDLSLSESEQEMQEISLTETGQQSSEIKSSRMQKVWQSFGGYAKNVKNTFKKS